MTKAFFTSERWPGRPRNIFFLPLVTNVFTPVTSLHWMGAWPHDDAQCAALVVYGGTLAAIAGANSVTTKSVMESSHIKLNVWLQAFFLMSSSKKGISSHQLHRALGITYKSAWFLTHRIREAMRSGGLLPPMGGAGSVVEACFRSRILQSVASIRTGSPACSLRLRCRRRA